MNKRINLRVKSTEGRKTFAVSGNTRVPPISDKFVAQFSNRTSGPHLDFPKGSTAGSNNLDMNKVWTLSLSKEAPISVIFYAFLS